MGIYSEAPVASAEEFTPQPSFFETHKSELGELFALLGAPDGAASSLLTAVKSTQSWVQGDHFNPLERTILSGEEAIRAREIYRKLGMVDAEPLPPGIYDQIIVLGGTQRANGMRIDFLRKSLSEGCQIAQGGSVVLWGGPRTFEEGLERPYINSDIGLTADSTDPWLAKNKESIATETDGLRLKALALGKLSTQQIHLRLYRPEELSGRLPVVSRYVLQGEEYPLVLLNAAPTHRPNGEPRHTTSSCARQWLQDVPPSLSGRVGFISSNPYLQRTAEDVVGILTEEGREDVQLIAAGPAAYDDAGDYLFKGEIARRLFHEFSSAA